MNDPETIMLAVDGIADVIPLSEDHRSIVSASDDALIIRKLIPSLEPNISELEI